MPRQIERTDLASRINKALGRNPVVLLLGPRQCGKTTAAREIARTRKAEYFDLESPMDYERLRNPMTTLEPLRGLIVIDEAQLRPDLFPILRVLADRERVPAKFLLLGSASPDLIRGSSESLAGRVEHIPMSGFNLAEAGPANLRTLWWRGGFPRSFLAADDESSHQWRSDFIHTFLERDLRRFGVQVPPPAMRRLWTMLAHYHGQILNASEIGRSLGEAHTTVKRHIDVLCGAFLVRQLQPWFENVGKRQYKSPKVYVRDSGLLHNLLGMQTFTALESHPKLGASWEGFAIEEILRVTGESVTYFWGAQSGPELDLLVMRNGKRIGIEVKYADAPTVTNSMKVSRDTLGLDHLYIVHPGSKAYSLGKGVDVLPLPDLLQNLGRKR